MSGVSLEELALAARNSGMPLEGLRWDVTPVGMHYLLIHYDVPQVDAGSWRLTVEGAVERPLSLSLDDLRARPSVTVPVTMECAGNGRAGMDPRPVSQPWLIEAVGTGSWTGTPLRGVLEDAGVAADAVEVAFRGLDRGVEGGVAQAYERALSLGDALADEVLLVWGLNGEPLPPQHGFPLRLIVPGWYGMTNVKWLSTVRVLTEPFDGYQNTVAYRIDDQPLSRIRPRALMAPPGVPEFMSRRRHLDPGAVRLQGRAWSGLAPVARVEVSVDGGASWAAADLDAVVGRWAWRGWSYSWDAPEGEHVLSCRCVDEAGNTQPDVVVWNKGGYANNAVQRVPVVVGAVASGA